MRVAIITSDGRGFWPGLDPDRPSFGTAPEALLQGFARMRELEVHVISCTRSDLKSPMKLADNITFHSLRVARAGWGMTLYSGCVRAVRRKLKELNPDIVHGQGTERDCALAAVRSGYPNVITLHGIMSEMAALLQPRIGSHLWLTARLENYCLSRTAGVICNSHFTLEKVQPRTRKAWLVPNPVRQMFFQAAPARSSGDKCRIVCIGSVVSYKRQNELLDLAERLHAEGFQFELRFAGQVSAADHYGAEFLRRIEKMPYVSYTGLQTGEALVKLCDEASALVHVSAVESFGLVVAEALCRNLRFFGFRVGGVPDIVEGVDGAELFADGDWEGLGVALKKWIASGFRRNEHSSEVMRGRYHPSVVAQRHFEIYREVLSNRL